MLFQYGIVFHIGTQHDGTRFIKDSETHTASKSVPFWNNRRKTTLSGPIIPRTACIPRTALMDKAITWMAITVSSIGTVLA